MILKAYLRVPSVICTGTYLIKNESDLFKRKIAKNYTDFFVNICQKLVSGSAGRVRIRQNNLRIRLDLNPQHCSER
jgi:hypothetical protein